MAKRSKQKPRPQHVTLSIDDAVTSCTWSKSTIEIRELGEGGIRKRATLLIDRPATMCYLREQLNKIEHAWKEALERDTSPP